MMRDSALGRCIKVFSLARVVATSLSTRGQPAPRARIGQVGWAPARAARHDAPWPREAPRCYDQGTLDSEGIFRMCVLFLVAVLAADPVPSFAALEPLGRLDLRVLPEASGIVRSRRHPGVFWVHNDSGNPATLYAVGRDGRVLREFPLAVPNVDWEDIAADDRGRLYLGDIGNNGGKLAIRAVYRFDEPDLHRPAPGPLAPTAASFYRFPAGERFDAEGLVVPDGGESAIVVSKRLDGREAELFAVSLEKPAPLLCPALPRRVGSLPGFHEPVTGASLSPDGRHLAVCSTRVSRVYQREADGSWRLAAEVRYPPVPIEGVDWDGTDLILVSEGRGMDLIRAPLKLYPAR